MKLLVIGYLGKMGQRYMKLLRFMLATDELFGYDIDDKKPSYKDFTHFIIATPPDTHTDIITQIWNENSDGQILCEKPVVTKVENLPILQDIRLSAAMIERFSPMKMDIEKAIKNYDNCVFNRTSQNRHNIHVMLDLMIHDIDLYFSMNFDIYNYDIFCNNESTIIKLKSKFNCDFISFYSTEDIHALLYTPTKSFNLKNSNSLTQKYYGNKLHRQIEHFLNGERVDSYKAHEFILCQLART